MIVRKGTWIKIEDGVECSECGFHRLTSKTYHYCPNCGAAMDAEPVIGMSRETLTTLVRSLARYYYVRKDRADTETEKQRCIGSLEVCDSLLLQLMGQEGFKNYLRTRSETA